VGGTRRRGIFAVAVTIKIAPETQPVQVDMTGRVTVGNQQQPDGRTLVPKALRHCQMVETLEGPR
jgi:hypothetical protein